MSPWVMQSSSIELPVELPGVASRSPLRRNVTTLAVLADGSPVFSDFRSSRKETNCDGRRRMINYRDSLMSISRST